jgi:hypothetical protein
MLILIMSGGYSRPWQLDLLGRLPVSGLQHSHLLGGGAAQGLVVPLPVVVAAESASRPAAVAAVVECPAESVGVQLGPTLPVAVGPVVADVAASAEFMQAMLTGDHAGLFMKWKFIENLAAIMKQ